MYDDPVWFLVLSLFFPRIALLADWWQNGPMPFIQPFSALTWIVVPRVLVLIMIFTDQGFSTWFWIHLVVTVLMYLAAVLASNE